MKAELVGIASLPEAVLAELYIFRLNDGALYRRTTHSEGLWWNGNFYSAGDFLIKRGTISNAVGMEAQKCDLTLAPRDETILLSGQSLQRRVNQGDFDNASVSIYRARNNRTVHLFEGYVTHAVANRFEAELTVSDPRYLFNIDMPRNLYQPGCVHTLFDSGCGLSKAFFAANGSVQTGSSSRVIATNLAQADGYFDLGTVVFNTGLNAGVKRTVKEYDNGNLTLSAPVPFTLATGDTFTAYPGCNKLKATCQTKFNNQANFKGFPFIPVPESS